MGPFKHLSCGHPKSSQWPSRQDQTRQATRSWHLSILPSCWSAQPCLSKRKRSPCPFKADEGYKNWFIQHCYVTAPHLQQSWIGSSKNLKAHHRRNRLLNLSHFPKLILVCLNCAPFPTKLNLKTCIDSSPQDLLSIWKWSAVILPVLSSTMVCYNTFLIMGKERKKQSTASAAWFPHIQASIDLLHRGFGTESQKRKLVFNEENNLQSRDSFEKNLQ